MKRLVLSLMIITVMCFGFSYSTWAFGFGGTTNEGGSGFGFGGNSESSSAAGAISGAAAGTITKVVTGGVSPVTSSNAAAGRVTGAITGGNSQGVGNVNVDASTETNIPPVQALIGGAGTPGSNTTAIGRYLESRSFLGLYAYTEMKADAFTYGVIMLQSPDARIRAKGNELLMEGADKVLREVRKENRGWSFSGSSDRSMIAGG